MKKVIIILNLLLISMILSCGNNVAINNIVNSRDTIVDDSIYFYFLPFEKINFKSSSVKNYFKENIIIDSLKINESEGYFYFIYSFKDKKSVVEFFINPDKTNEYYYLEKANIKSNFVKLINGIEIGMSQKEVYERLKLKNLSKDTLVVIGGESYTRLGIIFKDKKLNQIVFPIEE